MTLRDVQLMVPDELAHRLGITRAEAQTIQHLIGIHERLSKALVEAADQLATLFEPTPDLVVTAMLAAAKGRNLRRKES